MKNNITTSNMSIRKIFAVHRTITTDTLITKHADIHCTKHAWIHCTKHAVFIAGRNETYNLVQAIFHEK